MDNYEIEFGEVHRTKKLCFFRSAPNFSIFFCAREVGHPAAKLMVLAVAIFMVACIKGVQKQGLVPWGSPMLTALEVSCVMKLKGSDCKKSLEVSHQHV